MTQSQALELMAKLIAAFPHPGVERATVEVYVEAIAELRHYEGGLAAVNTLIRDSRMLPRIAEILDEYDRIKDRYEPKQLKEPPMSAEQIAYNHEQAQKILRSLGSGYEPRRMP